MYNISYIHRMFYNMINPYRIIYHFPGSILFHFGLMVCLYLVQGKACTWKEMSL